LAYAKNFNHGTVGHNLFILTATLSQQIGFDLDAVDSLIVPENVQVIVEGR
jgi:hypothetical protein